MAKHESQWVPFLFVYRVSFRVTFEIHDQFVFYCKFLTSSTTVRVHPFAGKEKLYGIKVLAERSQNLYAHDLSIAIQVHMQGMQQFFFRKAGFTQVLLKDVQQQQDLCNKLPNEVILTGSSVGLVVWFKVDMISCHLTTCWQAHTFVHCRTAKINQIVMACAS